MFLDKMGQHFRIGIRAERVPGPHEFRLELLEILDDAVVYDPDLARTILVRVCILLIGLAVGCPAQMRDATLTSEILRDFCAKFGHSSRRFHASTLRRIDAGGVVAAVFKRQEAVQEDPSCVLSLSPRIGKNPAHIDYNMSSSLADRVITLTRCSSLAGIETQSIIHAPVFLMKFRPLK